MRAHSSHAVYAFGKTTLIELAIYVQIPTISIDKLN